MCVIWFLHYSFDSCVIIWLLFYRQNHLLYGVCFAAAMGSGCVAKRGGVRINRNTNETRLAALLRENILARSCQASQAE